MNLLEAMQMANVDGYTKGYEAALADAVKAIRYGRGDNACGEDIGKIIDGVLSVAEDRIRSLSTATTRIGRVGANETGT